MASEKRHPREEPEQATERRSQSSITVIRVDRDRLARDPFRYLSQRPRLGKEAAPSDDEESDDE